MTPSMPIRGSALFLLIVICLCVVSNSAEAKWSVYYTGSAIQMFGTQRGTFRTKNACERYRSSSPAFERNHSYCDGHDDDPSPEHQSLSQAQDDPDLAKCERARQLNEDAINLTKENRWASEGKYREAHSLCPKNTVIFSNLRFEEGINLEKLGRLKEAEGKCLAARDLNPSNKSIDIFLANLYLKIGDKEFTTCSPLGYFSSGSNARAAEYYELGLNYRPKDATLTERLAHSRKCIDIEGEIESLYVSGDYETASSVSLETSRDSTILNIDVPYFGGRPDPTRKCACPSQYYENAKRISELSSKTKTAAEKVTKIASAMPELPKPDKGTVVEWWYIEPEKRKLLLFDAADWFVLGMNIVGKVRDAAIPQLSFAVIASKTIVAGMSGADIYVEKKNGRLDEALGYLRDPAKAIAFAKIVGELRRGNTPTGPAEYVLAARAVVDPELATAGKCEGENFLVQIKGRWCRQVFWDSMTSPEAKAAMLREAMMGATAYFAASGSEAMIMDVEKNYKLTERWFKGGHNARLDLLQFRVAAEKLGLSAEYKRANKSIVVEALQVHNSAVANLYSANAKVYAYVGGDYVTDKFEDYLPTPADNFWLGK